MEKDGEEKNEEKKQNAVIRWLKNPRGGIIVALYAFTAICAAGAVLSATLPEEGSPMAYAAYFIYALAAVSLGLSVYVTVKLIPRAKKKIIAALQKREFTSRLLENYGFRTLVFAVVSLSVSAAYAVFNGVIAAMDLSVWYSALAAYYLTLAVMRGYLLFHSRKKNRAEAQISAGLLKKKQIETYRNCGILLILLPVCLSFAIMQMIVSDKSFKHEGLAIYGAAAYSFYKLTMAIINTVKARKNDDYTVRAIRIINLADGVVSLFALQVSMVREFAPEIDKSFGNGFLGAATCLFIIFLGVYMIITACVRLKNTEDKNG